MWKVENINYKKLRFTIKNEKWQIDPVLSLNYKSGDERVNEVCDKWYEANFVSIQPRSYTNNENKTVPGFEVILNDEIDWEVRFTAAWTNPSRFFVNSLLWWTGEKIGRIRISTSAKEFNWTMRANLWVNIDGQPWTQFLDKEAKNKLVTPIKDPDTWEIIKCKYDKLETFLESKYEEINAKAVKEVVKQIEVEEEFSTPLSATESLKAKANKWDDSENYPF